MVDTHANGHPHRDNHSATVLSATDAPALLKRVSWGAIFAGTAIALGLLILMGLLGTAIGFRAVDPQQDGMFDGVGIGAGIWWIVTSILALGIGGYVAGHLSGMPDKNSANAHGATVWGLLTIVMLWLATSTVGTVLNTATSAVSGAAQAVASTADAAGTTVLQEGVVTPNQAQSQVEGAVETVRNQVEQVDGQALRQDAARVAESGLDALSSASWYAFIASVLSLVAAIIAAGIGAPHRTFVTARDRVNV